MLIFGGKLVRPTSEIHGVFMPGLDYQVRDGKRPMTGDYRGPGVDNGDRILLGDVHDRAALLVEYTVDAEPTVDSVEYQAGYAHAVRQLRGAYPASRSGRFQEGWRDARRELAKESQVAREARLRAIRSDRRWDAAWKGRPPEETC